VHCLISVRSIKLSSVLVLVRLVLPIKSKLLVKPLIIILNAETKEVAVIKQIDVEESNRLSD
jgi:hypothetical protein